MYEYLRSWAARAAGLGYEVAAAVPDCVHVNLAGCREYALPANMPWPRAHRLGAFGALVNAGPARRLAAELRSVVGSFRPSLIHFTDVLLYSDYLVKAVLRTTSVPTLFTLHDPVFHDESGTLPGRILKARMRTSLCRLSRLHANFYIHVHDRRLCEQAPRCVRLSQTIELPHPLPEPRAVRRRDAWRRRGRAFRIGFMGRIEPYKGLGHLRSALAMVFERGRIGGSQIEVSITGRGPVDENSFRSLPCEVAITNGFVSDGEFHARMAELDLLVLPYEQATQSGVAAMAVSYGIPMIATDVGALRTFCQHWRNGILIPPERIRESVAKALEAIMLDPGLYDSLLRGAHEVRQGCNVDYPEFLKIAGRREAA
jgi:glycosyltransferase involved in cell wall biosynthesis